MQHHFDDGTAIGFHRTDCADGGAKAYDLGDDEGNTGLRFSTCEL